MINKMAGVCNK